MKLIKSINVLFLLFASVLITSCENEPVGGSLSGSGNGGGNTTGYYLRVTVDGSVKQWSTFQAKNFAILNTFAIISSDGSISMNLNLHNVSDVGVYNLSWAEISCVYIDGTTFYTSDYDDLTTSPGNITITELDKINKTIKGTFNFIGKNQTMTSTKVFTKGEFFMKYTVE